MIVIHIESCSTLVQIVDDFKRDDITFKLMGRSYEDFSGAYAGFEQPQNNKWFVKILLLSSIGEFYYHEVINLKDTEKITDIKSKLVKLRISYYHVDYTNGIINIE